MSRAADIARAKADIDAVYDDGFAEGKQAERNALWDGLQQNGERTDYRYAFYGLTDNAFYPIYDIKPTVANQIFSYAKITNLKQRLIDCGVKLDFSQATAIWEAFFRAYGITHIPVIDSTSASSLSSTFADCSQLVEIEKLILKDDGSQALDNVIGYCPKLERITIEGVIGKGGFNASRSPYLSKESITSIINALSTTTSGLTVTLSKTAVNNAFATAEGAGNGSTSVEWLALVATRSNWTIALA